MRLEDSQLLPWGSRVARRWFGRYLRFYFGRHFDAVRISRSGPAPRGLDRSCVIYANHPSWWDPILYLLLSSALFPSWEVFGPMDSEALSRYPIFRRLGAFGVERGTHRGAVEFLRTSENILARPRALLWITAEGTFRDPRARPVELQFGLAHLVRRLPGLVSIPAAVEYPFWNERQAEVLIRFGEPVLVDRADALKIETVNRRLELALETTMDRLAEEALSRDPSRFDTLILGKAGVGGIYDLWRRARQFVRGESGGLSHEERR